MPDRIRTRKPTEAQQKKLDQARKMMQDAQREKRSILSRFSTTAAKSARDDEKISNQIRQSVPPAVRMYEDMQAMKKGGKVKMAKKKMR
jgi:hypothetical protein